MVLTETSYTELVTINNRKNKKRQPVNNTSQRFLTIPYTLVTSRCRIQSDLGISLLLIHQGQ
jgi:hypothetical protein